MPVSLWCVLQTLIDSDAILHTDQWYLRAVPQDYLAGVLSGDVPQKVIW